MKEQKGITLVALVITIIVLLILAGVSIAALSGQNGILTNATNAKQQDELGAAKDQINLAANEAISDYYKVTYASGTGSVGANEQETVKTKIGALGATLSNGVAVDIATSKEASGAQQGSYKVTLTSKDGKATSIGYITSTGSVSWE